MADTLLSLVKTRYKSSHTRFLKMLDGLTDAQIAWQATPTSHTIAFQAWHGTRLEDYFQLRSGEVVPAIQNQFGPVRQVWVADGLASRWGLDHEGLGWNEVGFGMDDGVAARLKLPNAKALIDYARRVFRAADGTIGALSDTQFMTPMKDWAGEQPIAGYLVEYLAHTEWDIGQIAALRRAQNLPRVIA
jgi:hypothetical protein